MLLIGLKNWYDRYKDLWILWKEYKLNGLTPFEISVIELYRDNDFKVNPGMGFLYRRTEVSRCLVQSLTEKLRTNYPEYQEWLTLRFKRMVLKSALYYGMNSFLNTPIDKLPIGREVTDAFKIFDCVTIQEIFNRYESSAGRWNEEIFHKVLKFSNLILWAEISGYYIGQDLSEGGRNIPAGFTYTPNYPEKMAGLPSVFILLN